MLWSCVCVILEQHFLKSAADLAVTLLSAGVRQHSDMTVVSPCLIHVYMTNLVRPSVRPVWPNQSLDPAADFHSRSFLPRWLSNGLQAPAFKDVSFISFAFRHPVSHMFHFSVWGHQWGFLDQVGCVMYLLSPLVPCSRRGTQEQSDACSSATITSSWTVRHYGAVRATSEPYADCVPLCFVPLHYGHSPSFFSFVLFPPTLPLSTMFLYALLTCLLYSLVSLFVLNLFSPPVQWEQMVSVCVYMESKMLAR